MALIRPLQLRCEYRTDPIGIDAIRPRLSWQLAPIDGSVRDAAQSAYQILVASDPQILSQDRGDRWDSSRVASSQQSHIAYDGQPLNSEDRCWWKVRVWDTRGNDPLQWSEPATWSMGLLGPAWSRKRRESDGPAPKWIGPALDTPWSDFESGPAPLLRKSFDVAGDVKRATIYASALGLYELHLNGRRMGDQELAPEWTDYRKRIQYQTYDVTDFLARGANAIGAILAPGWYAGRIGLSHISTGGERRGIYGHHLRLHLELRIETADGKKQVIRSDDSWRYTMDGPIRAADLLDGETYDARRERDVAGWDSKDFDDTKWQQVTSADFGPRLAAQRNEPVRITEDVPAKSVSESKNGVYIFDLGQNIAGRCRLRVRGNAGDRIVLRHAEVLNSDGTIYRENLRIPPVSPLGAPQEDRYVCRGDPEGETFEPQFTYHGFRYVEISGLTAKPQAADLVGRVLHSDAKVSGQFSCSSELLNRIMRAVVWTQRDNMPSVPTDCPQRDERFGWTGDMQVFCGAACFNMDMAAFLAKWLRDIIDAQAADGRLPDFAPHPYDPDDRFSGNPGWGDALPIVAWTLYTMYGDRAVLEEAFEPCARFVDWIRRENPDLIWRPNPYPFCYGDWLTADTLKLDDWPTKGGEVPKEIYATAFFAHDADLVAKMASVLGRDAEAKKYSGLAAQVREAFNRNFVDDDVKIPGDTQAGYAMALAFDLLPEPKRQRAAQRMVEALKPYHGHLSTGFQSTLRMMLQLVRFGHADAAYELINKTTIPSWGYMVEHGGTTIWERWDSYVEGRGFQNPGMTSFCHYAIGAVGEWMYRIIGGINPDASAPGFERVNIRPIPGGGLTWAKVSYESIRGTVGTHWWIDGGKFQLDVTIPPNVKAMVEMPKGQNQEVGSGAHHFECEVS